MQTVITANPHDRGYEIIAGRDITGPQIGTVWYDGGFVVRLYDANGQMHAEDYFNDAESVRGFLADYGFDLEAQSMTEVASLGRGNR